MGTFYLLAEKWNVPFVAPLSLQPILLIRRGAVQIVCIAFGAGCGHARPRGSLRLEEATSSLEWLTGCRKPTSPAMKLGGLDEGNDH
jgi:hypothetical protein